MTLPTIGWIGLGRMGQPMAARLVARGYNVSVQNRTRAKAEPLRAAGAHVVDRPADLADRDFVFTMVSTSDDLMEVLTGADGLLTATGRAPRVLIDCSTISSEASASVRHAAQARGCALLAAPVSGNAKVVKAGKLTLAVSGEAGPFAEARPTLQALGAGVTYVGEGELARIVKICHNLLLGVVAQALAEILVLGEKSGVRRHAMLDFINHSVMGSIFTRYKTPAFVNLDYSTTFTPILLRKDLDLGLSAARQLAIPMPVTAATRAIVQSLIDAGVTESDFAALLSLEAKASGLAIESENVDVGDGLSTAAN